MRLFIASIIIIVSAVGWADTTAGATRNLDHSAFFNGAGYQDNIPLRVGPRSTTIINVQPGVCYPYPHFRWVTPVRSYWVPGYYQWTVQRVWVQPTVATEWVPPVYGYEVVDGRQIQVVVRQGYYQQVVIPGHYEERPVQLWVEGYWSYY